MIELPATRYDGTSSSRTPVTLRFGDDVAVIRNDAGAADDELHYPFDSIRVKPPLAGMPTQLRFSDGSQCEIAPHPQLKAALAYLPSQRNAQFIHKLENHLPYVLVAAVLAVVMLFGVIKYGVPIMARVVAERMPIEIEAGMGRESLALFDRVFVEPSALPLERRQILEEKFQALAQSADAPPVTIHFRKSDALGANAFALPSGIIIFTDDIVQLASDDHELVGVFAHELGHVVHRHTLRHLLQDSATGLLLILLTGDIGSASSLAAALPTLLVRTQFSREFESEADDYAVALLRKNDIEPRHLGEILRRMENEAGGDGTAGFLSTHPATNDRVQKFNGELSERTD